MIPFATRVDSRDQKTCLFRTWLRSDEIEDEYVCRRAKGETRNVYDPGKRLRRLTKDVIQSKMDFIVFL